SQDGILISICILASDLFQVLVPQSCLICDGISSITVYPARWTTPQFLCYPVKKLKKQSVSCQEYKVNSIYPETVY
ncbi:unnamed protein product, partial [marine sediment metagenome]